MFDHDLLICNIACNSGVYATGRNFPHGLSIRSIIRSGIRSSVPMLPSVQHTPCLDSIAVSLFMNSETAMLSNLAFPKHQTVTSSQSQHSSQNTKRDYNKDNVVVIYTTPVYVVGNIFIFLS